MVRSILRTYSSNSSLGIVVKSRGRKEREDIPFIPSRLVLSPKFLGDKPSRPYAFFFSFSPRKLGCLGMQHPKHQIDRNPIENHK
jgi:hypothetical protein